MDRAEELLELWDRLEATKRDQIEIRRRLNHLLNQMTPAETRAAQSLYNERRFSKD